MNFKVLSFLALLSNGALAVFTQETWESRIPAKLASLPATDESICCDASNVSGALTLLCYFLARTDISLLLHTRLRNVNVETISTTNKSSSAKILGPRRARMASAPTARMADTTAVLVTSSSVISAANKGDTAASAERSASVFQPVFPSATVLLHGHRTARAALPAFL